MARHDVVWVDAGREPQCDPDPAYPTGIDVDASGGQEPACEVPLAYPARRCGQYIVACKLCGLTVILTTAGRPDDPRSVKVACKAIT